MLTLIIKADECSEDVFEKYKSINIATQPFEKRIHVIFLAHKNYTHLMDLKQITVNNPDHQLFVCDNKTEDEEMIAMSLMFSKNNDVMLLTLSTSLEVVNEFLIRRSQGYKIIRTRRKTPFFHQIFRVIGNWTYNIGLKMLGKKSDNFSEAEVMYLDSNIVESLRSNMMQTRENRITNTFSQVKRMTVEPKHVFDNETKIAKQEQTMFKYGMWSFFCILIFIALATIYPCLYNFVYSWWMIGAIVVWVGFCLFLTLVCSKKVYYNRIGLYNRVNSFGEPLFGYDEYFETGDEIPVRKPLPKIDKPVLKNKIIIKK